MEKLAKLLNEKSQRRILDVGTGTGNFVNLMISCYKDYSEIVGIDTVKGALDLARNQVKGDRITFVCMDGYHMDYEDNSFDIISLSNSLHHFEHINKLFQEMDRVLKPGGKIIVAEMFSNNLTRKQLSHLKIHHFAAKIDRLRGVVHNDTYSNMEIVNLLNNETSFLIKKSWILHLIREEEDVRERVSWFDETITRLIERVPEECQTDSLIQEGNEIKEYMKLYGFDSCPTLIVEMEK